MKDKNGNKITEHEFTKDIGHRTESTMPTENWGEEFDKEFCIGVKGHTFGLGDWITDTTIKEFISTLLSEERNRNEILVNTILETKNREIEEERNKVLSEVKNTIREKMVDCDNNRDWNGIESLEYVLGRLENLKVK